MSTVRNIVDTSDMRWAAVDRDIVDVHRKLRDLSQDVQHLVGLVHQMGPGRNHSEAGGQGRGADVGNSRRGRGGTGRVRFVDPVNLRRR